MNRKCKALIDLDAVRDNLAVANRLAPNSRCIAVLKANAYGHGAVDVARALHGEAPAFAVAIIDEALELREAGIDEPLLVMEGVYDDDALAYAASQNVSIVVHDEKQLADLLHAKLPSAVSVWLKVDTGMHRLGLSTDLVADAVARLRASQNCSDDIVVCTHLATADVPGSPAIKRQIQAFDACVDGLDVLQSISNSGAIMASPASYRDWNRPGYMLYGNSPFSVDVDCAKDLRPAMTLQSEVIALHQIKAGEAVGYGGKWTATQSATIATIAIGYADGYPWRASDGTPTLINGHIAPLVGAVSMDMIAVDVSTIDSVAIGATVVLWGDGLSVNDVARKAGTIGYELLTNVSRRVPREYLSRR
jgi:alanine racemase